MLDFLKKSECVWVCVWCQADEKQHTIKYLSTNYSIISVLRSCVCVCVSYADKSSAKFTRVILSRSGMNEASDADTRETRKEFTMECPAWEKPGSTHYLSEY